jgi:cytochrome c biogenesis factor
MAFVAALIGCSMYEKMNLRKFTILVVGALGAGAVLVQVQWPTPNMLANLGIPLLIVALFAVIYRLVKVLPKKKRSLRLFGRSLLHFAIIVTLIGVFLSSTTKLASGDIPAEPNSTIETLGVIVHLKNFTVYNGTGNVHLYMNGMSAGRCYREYSALKLDVTIEYGGNVYHEALWIRLYTAYGIVCTPLIINTPTGDLYIHMHHTESMYNALVQALFFNREVPPEDLIVTVEIIPMVYLVWIGVTLLSIGMAIPLIKELVRPTRKKAGR